MRAVSVFGVVLLLVGVSPGSDAHRPQRTERCSADIFGQCLVSEFAQLQEAVDQVSGRVDDLVSANFNPLIWKWLLEKEGIIDTGEVILGSCQEYVDSGLAQGDGWYFLKLADRDIFPVYCDQTTLGGGWMRLHYKAGQRTCFSNPYIKWTEAELESLDFHDFAVSNKEQSLNSEMSWLFLSDIDLSVGSLPQCTPLEALASVINCLTPSGTAWSNDYTGGYLYISGRLSTLGSWTSMFYGCRDAWKDVGEDTKIRSGGRENHAGEFIHSSCNDYTSYQDNGNRITSRWNWDNTRSFWMR